MSTNDELPGAADTDPPVEAGREPEPETPCPEDAVLTSPAPNLVEALLGQVPLESSGMILGAATSDLTGAITRLSDHDVVEAMGMAEEMMSRWYAVQAMIIADLHARPVMIVPPPVSAESAGKVRAVLSSDDLTTAEISARLTVSPTRAGMLLSSARALLSLLPGTLESVRAGRVCAYKAQVIAKHVKALADHVHSEAIKNGKTPAQAKAAASAVAKIVEERVLGRAPHQRPDALGECVRRAVTAAHTSYAEHRRKQAAKGRKVTYFTGLPDGMASLFAELPAAEAQALWTVLDHYARLLRKQGDPRNLDQLRADLLVYLVTNPQAHEALNRHTARPGTNETDGGRETASGPTDPDATDATRASQRSEDQQDGRGCRKPVRAGAQVHVTVSLDTLVGASDEPGHLSGYGTITAQLARALALDPASTWRRLITDPLTGALIDYGTTTYRPPKHLADHVRTQDGTCIHAACTVSAAKCDLDHLVPYPYGTTSEINLRPACRRDHRLKHQGGWQHLPSTDPDDPAGTTHTVSATGHRYTRYRAAIGPVRPA